MSAIFVMIFKILQIRTFCLLKYRDFREIWLVVKLGKLNTAQNKVPSQNTFSGQVEYLLFPWTWSELSPNF